MKKLVLIAITLCTMMMAQGQSDVERFAFFNKQTEKWGFMDRNGKVIVEPKYDREEIHLGLDYTSPYSEGMAAVSVNGKWGFIDASGKMVIQPQYEEVSSFTNGVAAGLDDEGNVVFFDKTGKKLTRGDAIAAIFPNPSSELLVKETDNKYVFYNKKGEVVAEYDDWSPFSEGLARVTRGGYAVYDAQVEGAVSGYIDETGKVVIPLQFGYPANDFHEGLAAVSFCVGPIKNEWPEWKMGFIDKFGEFVIQPQYDRASDFQEGLARVELDGKIGFIDKQGKTVIQPQFYNASDFSDGIAIVENHERKISLIDKTGKMVAGYYDELLLPFKYGLALVVKGEDVYYIDKTGKKVLDAIH